MCHQEKNGEIFYNHLCYKGFFVFKPSKEFLWKGAGVAKVLIMR